jgi:hypothetical protein
MQTGVSSRRIQPKKRLIQTKSREPDAFSRKRMPLHSLASIKRSCTWRGIERSRPVCLRLDFVFFF